MYDIAIIGGGVSGTAIARELSKYNASVCVIERCEDVCCGTSKANSAIVHAGYDASPNSLMAKLDVEGSYLIPRLSKELDFHYENNGSLVVCMREQDLPNLHALYERGKNNGVSGLFILSKEEAFKLEPNLSDEVVGALFASTGGIVCPFGMNIAFAENAADNGVEFKFDTEVTGFEKTDKGWIVQSNQGNIEARCVVNAAGVYADVFHNMVSEKKINITPRRGDYLLLDRSTQGFVSRTIFQLPNEMGKGILIAPTVHGNIIVGPTAYDLEDKEGTNTTKDGIDTLLDRTRHTVKDMPTRQVITSFSGLRAHEDNHEFIIEEVSDAEGFFDCAGIESPGLSSSPAIGKMVSELIREKLNLKKKDNFISTRKSIINTNALTMEERQELIKKDPAYGRIVCRCELITEGEIRDAVNRPIPAKSLDGVKRRVRAGLGRCQGGFCSPKVMEIIGKERNIPLETVTKCGGNSKLLVGKNKDSFGGE